MKIFRFIGYLLAALLIITAVDLYRWPDSRGLAQRHLRTLNGEPLDLQGNGKPLFLYFWGSWCGICRHTSPQVQALQNAGYPVASIASHSGSDAELRAYMQQRGWDFPVVNDEHGALHREFAIVAVPTIAIIDNGRIRVATSGWSSAWGLRARYHLAQWLPDAN